MSRNKELHTLHERSWLAVIGGVAVLGATTLAALAAISVAEHGWDYTSHLLFGGGNETDTHNFDAPDASADLADLPNFDFEVRAVDGLMGKIDALVRTFQDSHGDFMDNPLYRALLDAQRNIHHIHDALAHLRGEVERLNAMDPGDPSYASLHDQVERDLASIRSLDGNLDAHDELVLAHGEYLKAQELMNQAEPGTAYDKDTGQWIPLKDSPYINTDGHQLLLPARTSNQLEHFARDVGGVRVTDGYPTMSDEHIPTEKGGLHGKGAAVDVVPNNWHESYGEWPPGMTPDQKAEVIAQDLAIARQDGFEAVYEDKAENLTPEFRAALARHGVRFLVGGTNPHLHLQFHGDTVPVLAGSPR